MALTIENTINLTEYGGNKSPLYVKQLSIIHESEDGELVQYYINPGSHEPGDKNTHAIGVYDEATESYSYSDYDEVEWGNEKHRVTSAMVDRLGVKAFPGMGAFAFYKLAHRKITRIVIPENRAREDNAPPVLAAVENAGHTVTFTITPPVSPEYECYRIVMSCGIYSEDYITYEPVFTAPQPEISGEYRCYAIGYGEEGRLYSRESNEIVLDLIGKSSEFVRPYYTTAEINTLLNRVNELERKTSEHTIESDVPANAVFTDTVYDDTRIKSQIRANLNNIRLIMDALFNQDVHWLVDSNGNQIVDSNGYPVYTAEYTSKLTAIISAIAELQSRKYLYWDEPQEDET